jgi:hypothetical protein
VGIAYYAAGRYIGGPATAPILGAAKIINETRIVATSEINPHLINIEDFGKKLYLDASTIDNNDTIPVTQDNFKQYSI